MTPALQERVKLAVEASGRCSVCDGRLEERFWRARLDGKGRPWRYFCGSHFPLDVNFGSARVCVACGREFISPVGTPASEVCSRRCLIVARLKVHEPRVCAYPACGEVFVPTRTDALYHAKNCGRLAWKERQRRRREDKRRARALLTSRCECDGQWMRDGQELRCVNGHWFPEGDGLAALGLAEGEAAVQTVRGAR
jgi:hypothetical protein